MSSNLVALVVTSHTARTKRKTSILFFTEYLKKMGFSTWLLSVGHSKLQQLIKCPREDYFSSYEEESEAYGNNRVWVPLIHPFNLKVSFLNRILEPLFSVYAHFCPLKGIVEPNVILIESGVPVLLVRRLHKKFPKSKIIYSVSDRLSTLGVHPMLLKAEKNMLPLLSKIRVPAKVMLEDYSDFGDIAEYIPHGLDKESFDKGEPSPYKEGSLNAISIGDMLFDSETIEIFSKSFPDVVIHLFGKNAKLGKPFSNVVEHGETSFEKIIPYVQHADIGLAPYMDERSANYLSQSSLKMIQYTYCKLPIVAPNFAASGRDNVCGYDCHNNESKIAAFRQTLDFDRSTINVSNILTWKEATEKLIDGLM